MDFFTTIGIASSVITIANESKNLKGLITKLANYIARGNCVVIIFGTGGTGKTTLSYKLTKGELEDFIYHETPTIEKVKLNNDIWGHYLVAPGQERRVDRYWPELFRKLSAGKVAGIINVVSFGYHSMDIGNRSYKQTSYYRSERESEFLEDYLETKRKLEIEYLKKLAENIKNTPNNFWMLTFVNKQDLWWDRKDEVKDYYLQGDYNKVIEDIYKSKGTKGFVHEYISAALFNCNFTIGNDFRAETIHGYDEPIRLSNYNNLVVMLNNLIHEK